MAVKSQKIVADLETTVTPDNVRAWAVGAVDIDSLETVFVGNNLHDFFEWLKDKNTVCYFHNLKFDGEFLLSYLLLHGFKYSTERQNKTFETLITDDGLFYSITVIFEKQNKKYKKVTFYDSLKKLPFKVDVISKAFKLKDRKLSIDYEADRPEGHVLTDLEREYLIHDCRIVAEGLQIQFAQGLKRMTNASDAMNNYKHVISKKQFERLFPVLPVELDADIRRAYKGGFVWLNPLYKNRRGLQGITLDVNSLYPWVMYTKLLPYGYPIYFEGEPEPNEKYPLYIVRIECAFDLKPGHIPTIQLKNNRAFVETEYLSTSDGDIVEMTVTNVDLELMKEHYELSNLRYIKGWRFKGAVGMFKDYIEYWTHIKETSKGALRQLAKLMLNSLYGKFATNPKARKKIPFLDEDDIVTYKLDDPELRDPVYTAMGAFITAYAREKTIRSGQAVYHRAIYFDTDSMHLIGHDIPQDIDVHPTNLGAWKNEGYFIDSKYIRAKTYMETMKEEAPATFKNYCMRLNNPLHSHSLPLQAYCNILNQPFTVTNGLIEWTETKITCAGMPDNVKLKVNYDNFAPGSVFDGKLIPKRYKGGVILENRTFTIK